MWDFANDAPYQENGTNFNPVTGVPTIAEKNLRFGTYAGFVQDDWKIRRNLTVNLGMRWEYFSPLTETKGNISNPILGQGPDPLAGVTLHVGGDLFATSHNNWGPQLGFAYNPTSKLVFRGGFGIGDNLEQLAITSNGRFNPPLTVNLTLLGSNILYALSSSPKNLNGYPSNPAAIQTFSPTTGLPITGAPSNLTGFPNFMPTSVTYRYSFEAQYDLGHNWMASLGYQGSKSNHLTRQTELNWVYYPYNNPNLANLDSYSNDANAHSNALLAEAQHHFSKNFEVDFQYRFSRSIDQGSQDYNEDPYPWNYTYTTGPADFDVTHSYKLWGLWTPTLFHGNNRMLDKIIGGWTLSGISTSTPASPGHRNIAVSTTTSIRAPPDLPNRPVSRLYPPADLFRRAGEEIGPVPPGGREPVDQELVLVGVEHQLEPLARDVARRLPVDRVAEHHVVRRDRLSDRCPRRRPPGRIRARPPGPRRSPRTCRTSACPG